MFPFTHSIPSSEILGVGDPTDHGSNLGVVAALALGILVLIGILVVLITRGGGSGPRKR